MCLLHVIVVSGQLIIFSEMIKEYGKKSPLENIKLHRTKCAKLITNVVGKSYYEELIEELRESKIFSSYR